MYAHNTHTTYAQHNPPQNSEQHPHNTTPSTGHKIPPIQSTQHVGVGGGDTHSTQMFPPATQPSFPNPYVHSTTHNPNSTHITHTNKNTPRGYTLTHPAHKYKARTHNLYTNTME
ncbi:alcohol dehydrogenase 1-like [Platysternon megacephalum]|uniref:Alcohol dehydrogenase 1-like n=1 Tax=Platysternon megacephalum TaxID=55544 RepID=A0A4D9DIK1_9SAUR|nr:alcohol dehydrogenase 1-like [Platysternon megacephalum]